MDWVKLLGGVSRKSAKQTSRSPLAAGEDERCVLLLQGLSLSCLCLVAFPGPKQPFLRELLFPSPGQEQRMLLQPCSSWGCPAQTLCPPSRCLCMQQFTLGTLVLFNQTFRLGGLFWVSLPLFF